MIENGKKSDTTKVGDAKYKPYLLTAVLAFFLGKWVNSNNKNDMI